MKYLTIVLMLLIASGRSTLKPIYLLYLTHHGKGVEMRHHVTIGFLSLIITIIAGCATHPSVGPTQPTYTTAVERDNFNSTDVSPGSTLPKFDFIGAVAGTAYGAVAGAVVGAVVGAGYGLSALSACFLLVDGSMQSLCSISMVGANVAYFAVGGAVGGAVGCAAAGANRETLDMCLNRRLIPEESQVGMDDNLDKPLKSDTLLSKLQRWLPHTTETTTVEVLTN